MGLPRRWAAALFAVLYLATGARVFGQTSTPVPLTPQWQAVETAYDKLATDIGAQQPNAALAADLTQLNTALTAVFVGAISNPMSASDTIYTKAEVDTLLQPITAGIASLQQTLTALQKQVAAIPMTAPPVPAPTLSPVVVPGAAFKTNTGGGTSGTLGALLSAGTATYSVGPIPGATSSKTGTISVALMGDQYQGDPLANISVDGQQVMTNVDVSATKASGTPQNVTLPANYDPSVAHTVAITFTNDAYAGTAATDRNLYVSSITLTAK